MKTITAISLVVLLSACGQTEGIKTLMDATPKKVATCMDLVVHAEKLTDLLEASYQHNADLSNALKATAVASFVPVIGLVAAAGGTLAGMGRINTGELRISLDRTRNRLHKMMANDECRKGPMS